jgi:hypothetical protein
MPMTPDEKQTRERQLYLEVQCTRAEYMRVSETFDSLIAEVRTRSHGIPPPDGLQNVVNLGNARRAAFEKYRQALNAFSEELLMVAKPEERCRNRRLQPDPPEGGSGHGDASLG